MAFTTEFDNSYSVSTFCDSSTCCNNSGNSSDYFDEIIAIFVVGGPGAGKGTQCKRISEEYSNIVTLSTGQLLRNFVKSGTKEAKQIKKQMDNGILVDINATEKLLKPEFLKYNKKCKTYGQDRNIFIIDGFPRDINILKDWENGMKNTAFVPFIIEFVCDDNVLQERLLNRQMNETTKRSDSNAKSIKNRISLYHNETQQVIDYFKKLDKYQYINANDSIDKVYDSFCDIINPIREYAKQQEKYITNHVVGYAYDNKDGIEYYRNESIKSNIIKSITISESNVIIDKTAMSTIATSRIDINNDSESDINDETVNFIVDTALSVSSVSSVSTNIDNVCWSHCDLI